jgi:hypothetical protein
MRKGSINMRFPLENMRKPENFGVMLLFSPFRNSAATFCKTHNFAPNEVHTSTHRHILLYNISIHIKPASNINKPLKVYSVPPLILSVE